MKDLIQATGVLVLTLGCGNLPTEGLETLDTENAAPMSAGNLSFGSEIALSDDLLVVAAGTTEFLPPQDPRALGAAYVYRRVDQDWELQAELRPDATWLINLDVAIVGDRVALIAPFDGRCRDQAGEPVPQSGSVYIYAERDGSWDLETQLCAPDPTGNGEFGQWQGTIGGDLLLGTDQDPASRTPNQFTRFEVAGGQWEAVGGFSVDAFDFTYGFATNETSSYRLIDEDGWQIEVRPTPDPTRVQSVLPCPDPTRRCAPHALGPDLLLVDDTDVVQLILARGERAYAHLEGLTAPVTVATSGDRAALVDSGGRLYLLDSATILGGPVSPTRETVSGVCAGLPVSMALGSGTLALRCVGTAGVVVLTVGG